MLDLEITHINFLMDGEGGGWVSYSLKVNKWNIKLIVLLDYIKHVRLYYIVYLPANRVRASAAGIDPAE